MSRIASLTSICWPGQLAGGNFCCAETFIPPIFLLRPQHPAILASLPCKGVHGYGSKNLH